MTLKRYTTSHGTMCDAAEVADLEKQLEAYKDAFDCIQEAMRYAESAIVNPDSVAYIDLSYDAIKAAKNGGKR